MTITAPPSTPDTDPSATRSFSATSVDPGEEITVTIRADNYGGLGRIVETLPSGFTSPDANGQTVTIRLLSAGPRTETYTVTASDNPGSHSFSGTLTDEDRDTITIGGATTVTITAPPSTPDADPSATRSFSATSVDPGEEITVTIRADNYGGLGRILETVPDGFTTSGGGQTVTLRLLQEGLQTRSYTVTASDNPGSYTFSGVLESEDKSETRVGGSSTVTVNAPPGPSGPALVLIIVGRPWRGGNGNHPGRQLRWVGTDCGVPAFRLHQPGRERPDRHAPVAAGRTANPQLYGHRLPITLALTLSLASLRVRTRARQRLAGLPA